MPNWLQDIVVIAVVLCVACLVQAVRHAAHR